MFSAQSSQHQNGKANKYSIITVIEVGPPVSEFSTRISKFYTPMGIEKFSPIGFNLGSS